jgi:oligopeptide transport system ATP-binding protein
MGSALLEVKGLGKYFPLKGHSPLQGTPLELARVRCVRAVDGVSFRVRHGQAFGLVGESGCGKSTLGRCTVRLLKLSFGEVRFESRDISRLPTGQLRSLRKDMQVVFQDPDSSLNPRWKVRDLVGEPLKIHGITSGRKETEERVLHLLTMVGLEPAHAGRYPHEFSGGQQQRIGIARAIAAGPRYVVLDEPTSALDVSVKVTIADLLKSLQRQLDVAYLLISHDLSVIRYVCDEVAVMYVGILVETGPTAEVFDHPLHPYTQALLAAVPVPNPFAKRKRIILPGEVPSPIDVPAGCRFYDRCPWRLPRCRNEQPRLLPFGGDNREVACFLVHPD